MTVARTRTKIVATLGPAGNTQPILERFIDAGVDVFRLNMSHGTQAEHTKTLAAARAAAQTKREHIAVIADLCGPKIRIGTIDERNDRIDVGDTCLIVRREIDGDATRFCTNYPEVVTDVQIGQRVLIDDGSIRLLVSEKTDEHLVCTCTAGGRLATRTGVN
ncbi:MAG: pyruvate kinase, partial [Planctomycetes bacterium]|nr:pyruvate kinase [Planctomycetota bacterium]